MGVVAGYGRTQGRLLGNKVVTGTVCSRFFVDCRVIWEKDSIHPPTVLSDDVGEQPLQLTVR